MRIAVCFSGQIRTGVEASENIIRYLGEFYPFCDFFIHTWDVNQNIQYCGSRIFTPEEKVSKETLLKIKKIYNPNKMVVEKFSKLKDAISPVGDSQKYLWYSFNKSIQYKKEYEEKNNFKYDIVIKLRFDIIFDQERRFFKNFKLISNKMDDTIYVENEPLIGDINKNLEFIDDVFFFGSSKNMDIKSEYYDIIFNDRYNGFELFKYLKKNKINILQTDCHFASTIYRKECVSFSPLNEFKDCAECDRYYYKPYNERTTESKFLIDLKEKYNIDERMGAPFGKEVFMLLTLKSKVKSDEDLIIIEKKRNLI